MATHRAHPNYVGIWVWLAALMLLSVLASHLPASAVLIIGIVLLLSLVKAMLVALYYMHLKFERRLLLMVIIPPLILAAILVIALLPDSARARRTAPPAPATGAPHHDTSSPHS